VILTVLGMLAFAVAAVALAVRYLPATNQVLALTAAFYPFFAVGAPLAVMLFALSGNWIAAGAAGALTVAVIGVRVPSYIRCGAAAGDTVRMRVMSANMHFGKARPDSLVRAAERHADVVAVQELTPALAASLSALDESFPHKVVDAREGAAGVGIWSRLPLQQATRIAGYQMAVASARIRLAGASAAATVVVVHLPVPFPKPLSLWHRDLNRLAGDLKEFAASAGKGAVLVVGDWNATNDMSDFRRLLRDGYHDATTRAGAGFKPTFPSYPPAPPLLGLDHILTYQATATSVRTLRIRGSDHRALVAEIDVPT
jgi:endonuclease/exonuclease/phosphatase (EEP) superfamily protein YafD